MEIKDARFISSAGVTERFRQENKKLLTMTDDEWEDLDAKALSTIHLCLADDVLYIIIGETSSTSLWNKL